MMSRYFKVQFCLGLFVLSAATSIGGDGIKVKTALKEFGLDGIKFDEVDLDDDLGNDIDNEPEE